MQRYYVDGFGDMIKNDTGKWCKYDDVAELVNENAMLREALLKQSTVIVNPQPLPERIVIDILLDRINEMQQASMHLMETIRTGNKEEYIRMQWGCRP